MQVTVLERRLAQLRAGTVQVGSNPKAALGRFSQIVPIPNPAGGIVLVRLLELPCCALCHDSFKSADETTVLAEPVIMVHERCAKEVELDCMQPPEQLQQAMRAFSFGDL